jgi:hypothetical protein
MTEDNPPSSPRHHGRTLDDLAVSWGRLGPDRQRLATLALDAMAAGAFASTLTWNRYVEAAYALLADLDCRILCADQLHHLALQAARPADPPAEPTPGTPGP